MFLHLHIAKPLDIWTQHMLGSGDLVVYVLDFSAHLIDAILIDFYRMDHWASSFWGVGFIFSFVEPGHINELPFDYRSSSSLSLIC
jgi:hypothetical protein